MDSLRTFKSFQVSRPDRSFKRVRTTHRSGNGERSVEARSSMIKRDLSNKPSKNRDDILKKLADSKKSTFTPSKKAMPKKEEAIAKAAENSEGKIPSDVGLNDPNDPMTSEKLKSVLSAGGVNFSGKEKDILSKILNG